MNCTNGVVAALSGALFSFFLLAPLPGCMVYPYQGDESAQTASSVSVDKFPQVESSISIVPESRTAREYKDYSLSSIRLIPQIASADKARSIVLSYYRPKRFKAKNPAIILLPITDGDAITENLARYFVRNGFITLRYPSRNELSVLNDQRNALSRFSQMLRDDVTNISRGLQWLKNQQEVDAHRIGIMGVSLGAILSALMVEIEPDIAAAVLVLGGGNLPGIFRRSMEKPIVALREKRFAQRVAEDASQGQDLNAILQEMRSSLDPIDPLRYSSRLATQRILMVNAYFDDVIERRYAEELWNHLQRPTLIYLPTGHYTAALFYHYARFKALRHFQRYLVEE